MAVLGTGFIVPAGAVFLLGDNLPESLDSRSYGAVPEEAIIGRVLGLPLFHGAMTKVRVAESPRSPFFMSEKKRLRYWLVIALIAISTAFVLYRYIYLAGLTLCAVETDTGGNRARPHRR